MESGHLAAGTSAGLVRKRNEDSAYAGRWLCAVADGLGGHTAGNIASAVVIGTLQQFDVDAGEPEHLLEILGQGIRAASRRLDERILADPSLSGMGTTLTALLWSGSAVAVANIGDSRAYLLRHGSLMPLTADHVMSRLVAHPSPERLGPVLMRYLNGQREPSPDLTLRMTRPGDRYLICSDGLSGVLGPDVIRETLASGDAAQTVDDLIRLTLDAGAPDNVTVIVADLPTGTWRSVNAPMVLGAASTLAVAG